MTDNSLPHVHGAARSGDPNTKKIYFATGAALRAARRCALHRPLVINPVFINAGGTITVPEPVAQFRHKGYNKKEREGMAVLHANQARLYTSISQKLWGSMDADPGNRDQDQVFMDGDAHMIWSGAFSKSPLCMYEGRQYHVARLIVLLMYSLESAKVLPTIRKKLCKVDRCVNPRHFAWQEISLGGLGLPLFMGAREWTDPWPQPDLTAVAEDHLIHFGSLDPSVNHAIAYVIDGIKPDGTREDLEEEPSPPLENKPVQGS